MRLVWCLHPRARVLLASQFVSLFQTWHSPASARTEPSLTICCRLSPRTARFASTWQWPEESCFIIHRLTVLYHAWLIRSWLMRPPCVGARAVCGGIYVYLGGVGVNLGVFRPVVIAITELTKTNTYSNSSSNSNSNSNSRAAAVAAAATTAAATTAATTVAAIWSMQLTSCHTQMLCSTKTAIKNHYAISKV